MPRPRRRSPAPDARLVDDITAARTLNIGPQVAAAAQSRLTSSPASSTVPVIYTRDTQRTARQTPLDDPFPAPAPLLEGPSTQKRRRDDLLNLVAVMLRAGKTPRQMASDLGISMRAVEMLKGLLAEGLQKLQQPADAVAYVNRVLNDFEDLAARAYRAALASEHGRPVVFENRLRAWRRLRQDELAFRKAVGLLPVEPQTMETSISVLMGSSTPDTTIRTEHQTNIRRLLVKFLQSSKAAGLNPTQAIPAAIATLVHEAAPPEAEAEVVVSAIPPQADCTQVHLPPEHRPSGLSGPSDLSEPPLPRVRERRRHPLLPLGPLHAPAKTGTDGGG